MILPSSDHAKELTQTQSQKEVLAPFASTPHRKGIKRRRKSPMDANILFIYLDLQAAYHYP